MARQEERAAYLFLLPWLIGLVVFLIGPIVASVLLSFTNWNLISPPRWVGLENYRDMIHNRDFWQSIEVTLFYAVAVRPALPGPRSGARDPAQPADARDVRVPHDPVPADGAERRGRGGAVGRRCSTPIWASVNQILRAIGIDDPPRWLLSPTWAVPAIVLMGLWGVGGGAIIYLAGLQNIPPAALPSGHDRRRRTRGRRSATSRCRSSRRRCLFTLLIGLIEAFQVFDTAFVLGGQPRRHAAARCCSTCSTCGTRASATAGSATRRRSPGCW